MLKLVAVAALLACSGCGTVVNLATPMQEKKVYGGVRNDVLVIEKLLDGEPTNMNPGSGPAAMLALAFIALPFLDLPLSFVGDTLTLPLTRWLDDR